MAPSHSRHLLIYTAFPLAALLSYYLWFRRKRATVPSDPENTSDAEKSLPLDCSVEEDKKLEQNRSFARSDSAPIDIVLPPELRSSKSSQLIISDEDLDLEIEKIKSMKSNRTPNKMAVGTANKTPATTPEKMDEIGTNEMLVIEPNKYVTMSPNRTALSFSPNKMVATIPSVSNTPNKITNQVSPKVEKVLADVLSKTPIKAATTNNVNQTSPRESDKQLIQEREMEEKVECGVIDKNGEAIEDNDVHRRSTERDSANHSPADVMLASPSLSSISDSHSEVSYFYL